MESEARAGSRTGKPMERSAEEWARELRQGDPEAAQLVQSRVARIVAYRGLGVPPEDRQDLEQEIVTAVWQAVNRPGFDFTAGFWGFLETVASRRCIDWLRARRSHEEVPDNIIALDASPRRRVVDRERSELASAALEALPAPCRRLVILRLRDDLSYAEIAERMNKSEGALRVQFHRCIDRARRIVGQLDESELK